MSDYAYALSKYTSSIVYRKVTTRDSERDARCLLYPSWDLAHEALMTRLTDKFIQAEKARASAVRALGKARRMRNVAGEIGKGSPT